jgi:2,5-diketo-D-gluconate reductase A
MPVLGFELTDDRMTRIASLDSGEPLVFSHCHPAMVSAIGTRRIHD